MSDDALEEICIGHLFLAEEKACQRFTRNDLRVLREAGNHILECDFCIADGKNKQCSGYRPARLHIYNVLPKEDSQ